MLTIRRVNPSLAGFVEAPSLDRPQLSIQRGQNGSLAITVTEQGLHPACVNFVEVAGLVNHVDERAAAFHHVNVGEVALFANLLPLESVWICLIKSALFNRPEFSIHRS